MKVGILIAVLILWGAPVLANSQVKGGLANLIAEPWFLHHLLATIVVAAVLFTLADVGAGVLALLLALLIVVGYLLSAAGVVGPALKQATEGL